MFVYGEPLDSSAIANSKYMHYQLLQNQPVDIALEEYCHN